MFEIFSKKKTLIFFFYLLLCVMVLQIVVLYTVLESQKTEIYNNEINAELERCARELNSHFEAVKNTAISICLTEEAISAFSKPRLTPLELQALSIRLRQYIKTNRYITEIYLYNPEGQVLYFGDGQMSWLQDFQFPETQTFLREQAASTKKYTVFCDRNEGTFREQMPVIRNSWSYRDHSEYLLFIDLDYELIASELRECELKTGGKLYVQGQGGRLICTGSGEEELFRALGNLPAGEETVEETVSDEKVFVKQKEIEQAALELFCVTPVENIRVGNLHTKTLVSINVILICALFLLAGLIFLFRHVRRIMRKNAELEDNKNRRNQFLKRCEPVISCLRSDEQAQVETAKGYLAGIMQEPAYQDVVLLRFDLHQYQPEQLAEKYAYMKRCEEILRKSHQAAAIYEQDEFIVFLISGGGLNYVDSCLELYRRCRAEAIRMLSAELSGYVSSSADISRLHDLYTELCNLAEYKFIYNKPTFLDYTLFWKRKDEKEQWNSFKIEMICNNIISPRQDVNMLVDEFVSELRSLSIESVRGALYTLFIEISKAIEVIKREENLALDFKISSYLAALLELNCLDDARELFAEITDELKRQRSTGGVQRHSFVIKQAMDVINERVCDPGLCRSMVADEIGISSSYLSRIFKDQVGVSLSEMINEAKMKIVEKELRTTNKSIKEIIEKVGIANQSYFTVVFKKKYGVSPTEYRNNKYI